MSEQNLRWGLDGLAAALKNWGEGPKADRARENVRFWAGKVGDAMPDELRAEVERAIGREPEPPPATPKPDRLEARLPQAARPAPAPTPKEAAMVVSQGGWDASWPPTAPAAAPVAADDREATLAAAERFARDWAAGKRTAGGRASEPETTADDAAEVERFKALARQLGKSRV